MWKLGSLVRKNVWTRFKLQAQCWFKRSSIIVKISAINFSSHTLHWDNRKKERPRPPKVPGINHLKKKKLHLQREYLNRQHLQFVLFKQEMFSQILPGRLSKAATTVFQGTNHAAAQAGSGSWWHPPGIGFGGMQDARARRLGSWLQKANVSESISLHGAPGWTVCKTVKVAFNRVSRTEALYSGNLTQMKRERRNDKRHREKLGFCGLCSLRTLEGKYLIILTSVLSSQVWVDG